MNSTYAVIRDGVVINMIIIDTSTLGGGADANTGKVSGGGGPGFGGQLVPAEDNAGIGWHYANGVFTAPVIEKTTDELARENRATATSEYDRASVKIAALNDRIADEDWSGTTESATRAELLVWTDYRKSLRAYISAVGGAEQLPKSPE